MDWIKSAIQYNGCKYSLFDYGLLDFFPKNIHTFYDLFAGSATVSMNVDAKYYIVNDYSPIYTIYNTFKNVKSATYFENKCWKTIEDLGIAWDYNKIKTKKHKKGYQKLRELYNNADYYTLNKGIYLWMLIGLCFSNTSRFNSSGGFNQTIGNRLISEESFNRIESSINWFKQDNVYIYNENAFDININDFKKNDFVYLDPPYLITTAGYNLGYDSDDLLFDFCNKLTKYKVKWAMSNVLKHRGNINKPLKKWIKDNDLFVHHFKGYNYTIRGTSDSQSDEVLICNY